MVKFYIVQFTLRRKQVYCLVEKLPKFENKFSHIHVYIDEFHVN